MKTRFKILYQNQELVVIDKPAGFHVHPPEINAHKVPREKIVLHQLRDQIQKKLFPVHRLDAGTSGVLLFALSSESAAFLCRQFADQLVEKKYWAVVRGFLPESGVIDLDLETKSELNSDLNPVQKTVPALTEFKTLKRIEIPSPVGSRFSTARYSWLEVRPHSGRFHQIRRHMNRISHPVIGDAQHGDSRHNQFFRTQFGISGLCLRAMELKVTEALIFSAGADAKWNQIETVFKGPSAL